MVVWITFALFLFKLPKKILDYTLGGWIKMILIVTIIMSGGIVC